MTKEPLEKIQSLAGDMAKTWGTLLSELGIAERDCLQEQRGGIRAGIFVHEMLLHVIAEEIIEILSAIYGEKK